MSNIVLQKKINNVIQNVYPKTLGSIVYVSDPASTSSENDTVLNTVLAGIKADADSALRTVKYESNKLKFYTEEADDIVTSTSAAIEINLPKEQFLDQTATSFYTSYDKTAEYATTHAFTNKDSLNGKPVLVLGVKTVAENGTTSIAYSAIDLSTLVNIYTGVAHTTSNPVGITVDGNGAISGSLAIQAANNALKVNASGELYVDDVTINDGTEGGIVIQDEDGKMIDGGIALKGSTESLTGFTATTIVGALNELNQDVTFGGDGQISLEEDVTIGSDDYDYYFSIDHIDAENVKNIKHADDTSVSTAGQILVTKANGTFVASTVNIDSISSSDVIAEKANKVEDAVEGNLAALNEDGDLVDSGIDPTLIGDLSDLATGETVVSAIQSLQSDVDLSGLQKTAASGTASVGDYSSSVDSIVEALNEVKEVADTALAGNGAIYYVAQGGTQPQITELDLIMQEI